MSLKKLHKLTLFSFLPPFFITLFVSVFLFFLVTVVITYLDDFLGKGLRTFDLVTLFTFAYIVWIPPCIPLAVLLASIMSFGNMAENYELAAMKSAGLSLFRIIKPVFVFIIGLAIFTFLFNNFILPVVQLKFQSLLWDIRQKKPTVNIKEGIFYNKIDNYSIRVGHKSANKDTLKDIFIYDHSLHHGNNIQMYAKSGRMRMSTDSSALILTLNDGNRYEEIVNVPNDKKKPMSQLNFKELEVQIELTDFKLKRTAEEQWKGNQEMLNIWQLDSMADSSARKVNKRFKEVSRYVQQSFYYRNSRRINNDTGSTPYVSMHALFDTLSVAKQKECYENALNITRSNAGYLDGVKVNTIHDKLDNLRYLTEWHRRIVVCFACVVLFFIGAPLGAIIRKGGLGLPVVVAVLFFLAYFILTEAFTSLSFEGAMPPWQAIWMPVVIFLPISVFLTYKAAKDSALFDIGIYFSWLNKFKSKKSA